MPHEFAAKDIEALYNCENCKKIDSEFRLSMTLYKTL